MSNEIDRVGLIVVLIDVYSILRISLEIAYPSFLNPFSPNSWLFTLDEEAVILCGQSS